jgi:trans-aconitate methyltransferase
MWNANLYDAKHAFVFERGAELLKLLDAKPGEFVVDLGCGTGHLTSQIAATGAEVLGLDSSQAMIDKARAEYPSLNFQLADATNFKLDRRADAIFSNAVLHWVQPPEKAVVCMAEALKPGGRLVVEFGGHGNAELVVEALAEVTGQARTDTWLVYYPRLGQYASMLERHEIEVTAAWLFDRLTPLEEGEDGLSNWLTMFKSAVLDRFDATERRRVVAEIEDRLRPKLWRDGRWSIDYRRLRLVGFRR